MKLMYTLLFMLGGLLAINAQPTDNAVTPPDREAEDVIGIFGEAYATVDGLNYDPNWGQSGHMLVNPLLDIGTGDLILAYPNFNYQGTELSAQDASQMEFLHVDVWVPAGTDRMLKVSPIDNSGSGPGEVLVEVPLTPGAWNSVDLDKSLFTGMSWSSVFQMKFDGQFNSDGSANTDPYDVYLDNIYFWKNPTASGTDATLSDIQIDGASLPGFSSGTFDYTVGLPGGTTMVPQITLAITTDATATSSITQATGIPGTATVEVTSGNGMNNETYSVQFLIDAPSDSPADPTQMEADVFSVFSGVYTDLSGTNFDPNWGQSGHTLVNTEFDPGTGNFALAYPNFNYQGTEFEASQDLSEMEFVHIDVWVPAGTDRQLKFSPIDNSGVGAGEVLVEVPLTAGSWNSVDLPKSDFGDMSWNSVIQLKFDGQFNSDGSANLTPFSVYLDNIFFYTSGNMSGSDATLSDVQIDGVSVSGFESTVFDYTIELSQGTTVVPQITMATTSDAGATATINQAAGIPGSATVDVTSADGLSMEMYTFNYIIVVNTPSTSPDDPTHLQENVISIFSDTYTTVENVNYDPNWGQSGHTLVNPMFDPGTGNFALAYPNFNYQGTEFDAQDASLMEFLHVDVWVPEGTERMLKVTPIDNSGVGSSEVLVEVPITPGAWNSIDLAKSEFGDMSWNSIVQMKFDGQFNLDGSANTDPYDVYLDNVYFWKMVSSTHEIEEERISAYPNPIQSGNTLTLSTDIVQAELYSAQGQLILATNSNSILLRNVPEGLYMLNVRTSNGNNQVLKIVIR